MEPILQERLRFAPWMQPQSHRLPGIMPLEPGDWLQVDEAYAPQLSLKASLLRERPQDVVATTDGSEPAAGELLNLVLRELSDMPGFERQNGQMRRPDGELVEIDDAAPLVTLSRLVQEDFAILEKQGDEHVLTAALLCFPASWTLSEKIGKPLTTIHTPVDVYDDNIARRVQRMFDAIKPDRPLWRANALFYQDPALFQPRPENAPRVKPGGPAPYVRSERQSLLRLPDTGAVVFSIHTTLIRREKLTELQRAALHETQLQDARV